jgi:hypothetical protein
METEQKGFLGFLEILREDYRVHRRDWILPGFRAVALHRFGVWVGLHPRLLRALYHLSIKHSTDTLEIITTSGYRGRPRWTGVLRLVIRGLLVPICLNADAAPFIYS